jgi:arylsulfatase A-like enzyme
MCKKAPDENKSKCRVGGNLEYYVVDHTIAKVHFDERDLAHLTDLYDSGVRQLDTEISRLFGHLHAKDLLDETLLVVTSDHGEGFGEHGEVDHFLTTYQEVLHVPLLVRGKNVPANMRIEQPVSLVDIVPTILSQAGVRPPADLDGRDLSPLWRGEQIDEFEHRTMFAEAAGGVTWQLIAPGFYPEYRALRRGRYKMIYSSDGDRYSLYDLSSDPGETVDLAKREPELHAELRREMKLRYRDFSGVPTEETQVEMDQEDIDNLRALGYIQ